MQVQPNQQLEAAKNAARIYIGYFLYQLKASRAQIRETGNAHLINGHITIILFLLGDASFRLVAARYGALLVPLMALCAAGIILSLLGFNVFGYTFILSIMGAVFLFVHATLLIYVVSLVVLGLIGEYLMDALAAGLRSIDFDDIL